MPKRFFASIVVLATVFMASTATAQSGPREGFYAGLGAGWGSYNLSASGYSLSSTYKSNWTYMVEAGFSPSKKFRIGFEGDYYTKSSSGAKLENWFYMGEGTYYPSLGNNFYLKGGLGWANTKGGGGGGSASQGGFAINLGLGVDILPAKNAFALNIYTNYLTQLEGGAFTGSSVKYESHLWQIIGVAIAYKH